MAFSRYKNDSRLAGGTQLGTASAINFIRSGVSLGSLQVVRQITTTGDDRLDNLAGAIYGDSRYWWVLAAASNIGWGLQVPANTVINVIDLRQIENLVG